MKPSPACSPFSRFFAIREKPQGGGVHQPPSLYGRGLTSYIICQQSARRLSSVSRRVSGRADCISRTAPAFHTPQFSLTLKCLNAPDYIEEKTTAFVSPTIDPTIRFDVPDSGTFPVPISKNENLCVTVYGVSDHLRLDAAESFHPRPSRRSV